MKAKELNEKLEAKNYSPAAMTWLRNQFAEDARRLMEARNIKTDRAMLGIFKDHRRIWKAIARHSGGEVRAGMYFKFLELYAGEEVAEYAKKELN